MARKPKKVSVVSNSKPEAEQLSDRQRRILQVIRDAVVLRGYPPSIREIGDAAGLQSTSSVAYQLKELERKGFLRRDPNKPRAVDVRAIPGEELKKTATAIVLLACAEKKPYLPPQITIRIRSMRVSSWQGRNR